MKLAANTSTAKWATEPAFEAGMSLASPSAKMFGYALDSSVLVHRHEVELVAQAGTGHVIGAHVEGHGHEQVERNLALVVGHQAGAVDALHQEVGLHGDPAIVQHGGEPGRRDRLGERPGSGVA